MSSGKWRAPKLTEDGYPFNPAVGEPGAWVLVGHVRSDTSRGLGATCDNPSGRIGQVWSKSGRAPGDVWVVFPDQTVANLPVKCLAPAADPFEQIELSA
jgi:hypothetical protein